MCCAIKLSLLPITKPIREQLLFTTVAQKLKRSSSPKTACPAKGGTMYIVFGSPFLVLFWRSKKVQSIYYSTNNIYSCLSNKSIAQHVNSLIKIEL